MTLDEHDKKILLIGSVITVGAGTLFYLLQQKKNTVVVPPANITDIPEDAGTSATGTGSSVPGYTQQNMQPLNPQPLTVPGMPTSAAGATDGPVAKNDDADGTCGCCHTAQDQLATNDTYLTTQAYLNYLQNTNPYYVQLVGEQLQSYSALFATGETYYTAANVQNSAFGAS